MRGTRNSKLTKDLNSSIQIQLISNEQAKQSHKIVLSKTSAETLSRESINIGPDSRGSLAQSEAF